MADKMMRIGGRGEDGLAKAIKTDSSGSLEVRVGAGKPPKSTVLVESISVESGQTVIAVSSIEIKDTSSFYIGVIGTSSNAVSIDIQQIIEGYVLPVDERIMDMVSLRGGRALSNKYVLKTPDIRIKVTNHGSTSDTFKIIMYESSIDTPETSIMPHNQAPITVVTGLSVAGGATVTAGNSIEIGNYTSLAVGVLSDAEGPAVTVEILPIVGGYSSSSAGKETVMKNKILNGNVGISEKFPVRTPSVRINLKNHSANTRIFSLYLYRYNTEPEITKEMEYYGPNLTYRPDPISVPVGAVFMDLTTRSVYQNRGFSWMEV